MYPLGEHHKCEVRPCHCSPAVGNQRGKSTKAHISKIIYTPVFIDLQYMNGFQNNTLITKQKMEPNFPESCPVLGMPKVQELPAPQPPCRHSDLTTARALRILWIKSCTDDDFHYNINQTKVRTLALPPHFQCTSGRTIKGGLGSAYSSVLLLRLPA